MSIIDVIHLFPIPARFPREAGTPSRITDIAVHHTYIDPLPETATVDQELERIGSIHQYHISRGFLGVGYQGIAFTSGRGYITAPLSQWGANVYLENNHVLGVSVDNKLISGVPPVKQQQAVVEIIETFLEYSSNDAVIDNIRPHLYWGGTSCPGPNWREWVPQLKDKVKEDDMGMLEEHLKNHETFDKNIRNLNEWREEMKAWAAAHAAFHNDPLDPSIRTLQLKVETLEAQPVGGGISIAQVTAKVKELIEKVRLTI